MNNLISKNVVDVCKKKLILMREDILNRLRGTNYQLASQDKMRGDEIDQSVAHIEENNLLISQGRLRQQFIEIEFALSRIQNGTFGICEETHEQIEEERLLAIPFTRLSIEGAEMRESVGRRLG